MAGKFTRADFVSGAVFSGPSGGQRQILEVTGNKLKFKVVTSTPFSGKFQPGTIGELPLKEFTKWARRLVLAG